jgi:hypothetical protein
MFSAELQIAVSFSLVLGAIFGALLCSYMRLGRNRLLPSEAAFQACLELREKLEMLQQALQADVLCAPHPTRTDVPARVAGRPVPVGPARAALPAGVEYDPPVSSKNLPNLAAWRRIEKPQALAHHVARGPRPGETELVAPVRRRTRGTDRPAAIDARIAQEIVLRHFGVPMNPMPGPVATVGDQTGKLLRMPVSHAGEPPCDERRSFA